MDADASFLRLSVGEFLDEVAAREPAPGGGAAAAVTVATAAGLAAMAARFSTSRLDDASTLALHADRLRGGATPLADEDAAAYREVLDAYALPKEPDPHNRRDRIRAALLRAAEVPLRIAETGAEVARLGARLAADGNPNLRGDAFTAVMLADAATRSATGLVWINVEQGRLDRDPLGRSLLERARRCLVAAGEAARQVSAGASASLPPP